MSNTTKVDKQPIIEKFRKSDADTGSSEVQIAHLTDHLRVHRKDYHSRRGLIAMASRRRKLLDYVKRHDLNKYKQLLEDLNLRR